MELFEKIVIGIILCGVVGYIFYGIISTARSDKPGRWGRWVPWF